MLGITLSKLCDVRSAHREAANFALDVAARDPDVFQHVVVEALKAPDIRSTLEPRRYETRKTPDWPADEAVQADRRAPDRTPDRPGRGPRQMASARLRRGSISRNDHHESVVTVACRRDFLTFRPPQLRRAAKQPSIIDDEYATHSFSSFGVSTSAARRRA
jgi:hypothetical protein